MKLSLSHAARLLGKSERQIRYLIKTGRLKAVKDGSQWIIDEQELPASDRQQEQWHGRAEELNQTVEQALAPHLHPPAGRTYSVNQMVAFRKAMTLCTAAEKLLGRDHRAVQVMEELLVRISQGCHRFVRQHKIDAYIEARELAATALVWLLREQTEPAAALATQLEQELLPGLVGLVRYAERRTSR